MNACDILLSVASITLTFAVLRTSISTIRYGRIMVLVAARSPRPGAQPTTRSEPAIRSTAARVLVAGSTITQFALHKSADIPMLSFFLAV